MRNALSELMQQESGEGAAECDLLVYVVDASKLVFQRESDKSPPNEERLLAAAEAAKRECESRTGKYPDIVVLNKVDLLPAHGALPLISAFDQVFNAPVQDDAKLPAERIEIIPISAKRGQLAKSGNSGNLRELVETLTKRLPESEPLFAADEITTASERHLTAETIREQAMLALREELPYAVAVDVETFKHEGQLLRIGAKLVVEKDSQKGIVIGKGGAMLKRIGTAARERIESFFGKKVHLELVVVVEERWSESASGLKKVGII